MAHELFHVVQHELAPGRGHNYGADSVGTYLLGPTWLLEGGAEYVGFSAMQHYGLRSRDRLFRGDRTTAKQRAAPGPRDIETKQGYRNRLFYPISRASVDTLMRDKPTTALLDFYRSMGAGNGWQNAFKQAFGKSYADFYDRYKRRYGK